MNAVCSTREERKNIYKSGDEEKKKSLVNRVKSELDNLDRCQIKCGQWH